MLGREMDEHERKRYELVQWVVSSSAPDIADRIEKLEQEAELKDKTICELGDLMEQWKAIAEGE